MAVYRPRPPPRSQRFYPAPGSGCACQSSVGSDQNAIDRLCHGNVAGVVWREIRPKFPHSLKEGCGREDRDREGEKVAHGGVRLFGSQLPRMGVAPEDRCDLDSQEIWACDRLTVETVPEPPPVVSGVCERRRED